MGAGRRLTPQTSALNVKKNVASSSSSAFQRGGGQLACCHIASGIEWILIEMRLKKDSDGAVVVVGLLGGSNRGGWLQKDPAAAEQADGGCLVHRETFEWLAELQTTSVMKRGRKMKRRWSRRVSRWKLQLLFGKWRPLSLRSCIKKLDSQVMER